MYLCMYLCMYSFYLNFVLKEDIVFSKNMQVRVLRKNIFYKPASSLT